MILLYLLQAPLAFLNAIASVLPNVHQLPMGSDEFLSQYMGYVFYIMGPFPPIHTLYVGFLFIVGWKLTRRLMRGVPVFGKMI